jgi:hypothetical protein
MERDQISRRPSRKNDLPMKTVLLSVILGLFILLSGVPVVEAAEIVKSQVVALPSQEVAIQAISNLAGPEKLATLGQRGANPRVQKITYWLFIVRQNGGSLEAAIDTAFSSFGWKGTPQGEETKLTLIRSFQRAEHLGCFDAEGLEDMRRGQSATVKRGEFIGQEMSVDHILPRAKVPELDNVLANLELMPLKMNMGKSAKLENRQIVFARRFVAAGIISAGRVPWAAPFDEKTVPKASTTPATRTTANQSPVKTAPVSVSSTAGGYLASKAAALFHKPGCSSAATIKPKNLVKYASREEAVQAGKKPCSVCKP